MYEDTEQMSDGHRRSLSLPSHLGRQSSGQKRRDGPSIWDLQEALRREGHLDAESECTSEPGSEPSSAASTPHGSLGASSGAAFAEQFENAYGGGSWPRVRKQRTSERSASAMSLWEVSEALGGGGEYVPSEPHSFYTCAGREEASCAAYCWVKEIGRASCRERV